jgi:hypothetical protein
LGYLIFCKKTMRNLTVDEIDSVSGAGPMSDFIVGAVGGMGALDGAALGLRIGALGGPIGAVIGAGLGAAAGGIIAKYYLNPS